MDTILIAQFVGALGVGVFLFCYHFKDMKNVLKVKLLVGARTISFWVHMQVVRQMRSAVCVSLCS